MKNDNELRTIFEREIFEMIKDGELTLNEFIRWTTLHNEPSVLSVQYWADKYYREKYNIGINSF